MRKRKRWAPERRMEVWNRYPGATTYIEALESEVSVLSVLLRITMVLWLVTGTTAMLLLTKA